MKGSVQLPVAGATSREGSASPVLALASKSTAPTSDVMPAWGTEVEARARGEEASAVTSSGGGSTTARSSLVFVPGAKDGPAKTKKKGEGYSRQEDCSLMKPRQALNIEYVAKTDSELALSEPLGESKASGLPPGLGTVWLSSTTGAELSPSSIVLSVVALLALFIGERLAWDGLHA